MTPRPLLRRAQLHRAPSQQAPFHRVRARVLAARPRIDVRWLVLAAAALAGLYGAAWTRVHAAAPMSALVAR